MQERQNKVFYWSRLLYIYVYLGFDTVLQLSGVMIHVHLHLGHLADAFIQSDLQ